MNRRVFEYLDYLRSDLVEWQKTKDKVHNAHGESKYRGWDIEIGRVKRAIFLLENSENPCLHDFFGDNRRN